jgi:hypothetical protein
MIIPSDQAERFYRIWFELLKYVNDEKRVVHSFPAQPKIGSVKKEDAIKIRNKLWKEDSLIDRFVAQNPAALSLPDLELVSSWKHRVVGNFFILQHLKKYSVFLSEGTPARAYGVLGLLSPFEEVVGPYLPVYVRGVLLPFGDKIIYDGLLESYNIAFGSGIRADMKMWLRDAEEREGIITSLIPRAVTTAQESKEEAKARNAPILREFQKALYKSGLSPKMVEQHSANIQFFADYLMAQKPTLRLLEMRTQDVEAYLNGLTAKDAKVCVTSFKRYERFLWDTARSDPDALDELRAFLKGYQHRT